VQFPNCSPAFPRQRRSSPIGGYDSNAVLDLIASSGAQPNIPSCARRLVRRSVDPAIYRRRNLIERFFCKLKQFRRVATRFDKLARNFLAAVLLTSIRLWLRSYESTP
jgi:transposase